MRDPAAFYTPTLRPSGHDIGEGFGRDNGGSIPPNLLQFPNTESNGAYLKLCKGLGLTPHPARFPAALPEFFIKFLTDPEDLVVDIFGGSGTTGEVAERLGRRWRTIDVDLDYVRGSLLQFADGRGPDEVSRLLAAIDALDIPSVRPVQAQLLQ